MQDNWDEFVEAFNDYAVLQRFRKKGKEMPTEELAALRLAMGSEARQVLKLNISLSDAEKKDPEVVMAKM